MTSLSFISDDSVQSTTSSISGASTSVPLFALNTDLTNLSTNSTLSLNNLNSTSTSILGYINSLSNNSTLSITNLNATSTTLLGLVNGHTTSITNLNATSTTLLGLVNGHTTAISNLNATSTTILGNLNSLSTNSILSINNINATSTTLLGLVNGHTTAISNINATSTTILGNLNSLSTSSILSINNINATSTTLLGLVNGHTTAISNINATSTTILGNLNSLSTNSILSINNINATSTTILGLVNGHTTSISNLNTALTLYTTTSGLTSLLSTYDTITARNSALGSYLPLTGGTLTGQIVQTGTNPAFYFGGGGGASFGQAGGAGAFSTSAAIGDAILRSQAGYQLLLQAGGGGSAITINSGNNVSVSNILNAATLQQGGVSVSTLITNALTAYLPLAGGTMTSSIIMTGSSSAIYFTGSGAAFGEAGGAGAFSSSAATNDLILRSRTGNNLILQSGANGGAIIINSSNNTTITGATTCSSTLSVVGNIDCGGGLALTGANAIYNTSSVDSGNYANTYLSLKASITNSDWCYIRQIGSYNAFKLAFDFHDDIDARFCIRSITSTTNPDTIVECFTVDNGNVSCTGSISCLGTINCPTINTSGINLTDGSYINYPNYLYFKNTIANKTITFSSGHINAYDLNLVSNLNLLSLNSAITFYNKWFIFYGSANGVANSLIFNHVDTGINSYWWFNGTQTSTQAEISDERVKKQIENIENPLNKFMLLKPKQYYLCDNKDYTKKFGVIAQDVEIDFPELIYTDTEYIANIYSYATYDNFIITFDKDITNLINIDDELKIVLDNNDKNNLEIVLDDTPYNNRNKKRYCKVIEIIDNYSFKIDIELKETNVFIFGKKVNDFKKLDYQSLYCLNIAATQELYNIIQQLQNRILILESK